jgi:cytidine deaminase
MSTHQPEGVSILTKFIQDQELDGLEETSFEKLLESDHSEIDKQMTRLARKARKNAFAPYSEYPVGSSLLTEQGVYLGANIEISGRSTSVHAEMLAAYKAVYDGATDFKVMAVSAGDDPSGEVGPCGLCQHTLSQFTEELRILEDCGEGTEPAVFSLTGLIGDGYSASTRHLDTIQQ